MKKLNLVQIRKDQAKRLRAKGMGYKKISNITGLDRDAIRYECREIEPGAGPPDLDLQMKNGGACAYCGDAIEQPTGSGRPRRFCSTFCRREYWKIHRMELKQNPDSFHVMRCAYCGKTFEVYGRYDRKYCCQEHYLFQRYGEKLDNSVA